MKGRPRVLATLLVKTAWGLGGGILTLLPVFGEKAFPLNVGGGYGGAALGMSMLYVARGVGTAVGPMITRRFYSETRGQMERAIGVSFVVAGAFYMLFGTARTFALALCWLAVAHMAGSVLWVFSTVLLQATVDDEFRGRVFAAELMLMTLSMAASNYVTGEALDRFNYSPRAAAVATGVFFTLPGLVWFFTRRLWDKGNERDACAGEKILPYAASGVILTPPSPAGFRTPRTTTPSDLKGGDLRMTRIKLNLIGATRD